MKHILIAGACVSLFISCNKEKGEYNPAVKADLTVEFDNIAGSSDLVLNTATYTNAAGQNFNVTKLKYYVSNFKLTNVDGSVYTVPQEDCYFLVDESVASSHQPPLKVPEGEYKTLSFMIGVDSLRNTMDVGQRTGVLDVSGQAADMYWSWNSGYIFFKLEGTSPSVLAPGNIFKYHIGGFGGYSTPTPNNLKTFTLDLTARGTPKVKAGKETNIHLMVDIMKTLNGINNISLGTPAAEVHSPAAGTPMADNYASMINHDHTEN
ncbi:MAG TPA: hypothetical protein PKC72_14125 [Chitinophagaceae bacterium]|nr:hypothetical protein [Chitinophagaceae bacterium]